MKKFLLIIIALVVLVAGVLLFKNKKSTSPDTSSTPTTSPVLINSLPVTKRPFITLTPDPSGKNLILFIDRLKTKTLVEYELIYQASGKEEGAIGRVDLSTTSLPVSKKILLGSKSAGGSVTYHEGVTGGALTIIYDNTKLKEEFNFQHFSPSNSAGYSTPDARFTAYFSPKSLPPSSVIVLMKSFGLPANLPSGTLKAGPYYVGTAKNVTPSKIELRVHATNPKLYEFVKGEWQELSSTYENGLLSATPTSNLFIVTE